MAGNVALCAAALLFLPHLTSGQNDGGFEPLTEFPVTDTRPQFTYELGRDLVLRVKRDVDAQARHLGWDLSIVDRRLPNSPDFFYECLCGHGPMPQQLLAWHFPADQFPNPRRLPVWGYPYEIRVTCEGCTVAGAEYAAQFTAGTVKIASRRLAVANPRQRRLSDLRGHDLLH